MFQVHDKGHLCVILKALQTGNSSIKPEQINFFLLGDANF